VPAASQAGFAPIALRNPLAPTLTPNFAPNPTPCAEHLHIELRRGALALTLHWPLTQLGALTAWIEQRCAEPRTP
jgi:hypothetical protein